MESSNDSPISDAEKVAKKVYKESILEPLYFSLQDFVKSKSSSSSSIPCMLCVEEFENATEFVQHMNLEHNVVIAKTKLIADMKRYAEYWKKKFQARSYTDTCSEINIKNSDERFFLLCDALPEDQHIRETLHFQRAERVLTQYQLERNDVNFKKPCFLCNEEFTGNRSSLFLHFLKDHNFNIGHADNIVFVNDLLSLLDEKFNKKLQCIYCERVFHNKVALKDHIRKKQHKLINPHNQEYDKYYLINYLSGVSYVQEMGKSWEDLLSEVDDDGQEPDLEVESTCWEEEAFCTVCLFCSFLSCVASQLLDHMKDAHRFDLVELTKKNQLTFYQKVKLVNYIRRQMYRSCCFYCGQVFLNGEELHQHMSNEGHFSEIPENKVWDQPHYYFPTYENDNLLCILEDDSEGDEGDEIESIECGSGDHLILCEDRKLCLDSILNDDELLKQLQTGDS